MRSDNEEVSSMKEEKLAINGILLKASFQAEGSGPAKAGLNPSIKRTSMGAREEFRTDFGHLPISASGVFPESVTFGRLKAPSKSLISWMRLELSVRRLRLLTAS